MKNLKADSRRAGLGKTTEIVKFLNSHNGRYIVAAPSVDLLEQYENALVNASVIHSRNKKYQGKVATTVFDALLDTETNLVISHKMLEIIFRRLMSSPSQIFNTAICDLDMFTQEEVDSGNLSLDEISTVNDKLKSRLKEIYLVIDETLSESIKVCTLSFYRTNKFLEELSYNKTYFGGDDVRWIEPKNDESKELLAVQAQDKSLSKSYRNFLNLVLDKRYRCLINKSTLDQLKLQLKEQPTAPFKVSVAAILDVEVFNAFKSTKILSADFDKTELALAMSYQGVTIQSLHAEVSDIHSDSELITMHYFSERDYSSMFRNAVDTNGKANKIKIAEHIKKYASNEKLIWNSNVDDREELAIVLGNSEFAEEGELVTSVHGLNKFKSCHVAAYLSSAKLLPSDKTCLESLGVDAKAIELARTQLKAYQFVMRTSIRDRESIEPVDIFLTDKATVYFLKRFFPNADIKTHDIGLSDPAKKVYKPTGNPKGRPSSNNENYIKVRDLMSSGRTQKDACKEVGIDPKTYRRYKTIDREGSLATK